MHADLVCCASCVQAQPAEGGLEDGTGAADVHTDKALAAGAEHFALVHPQAGALREEFPKLSLRESQSPAANPEKLGSLRPHQTQLRQMVAQEGANQRDIFRQIGDQFIKP